MTILLFRVFPRVDLRGERQLRWATSRAHRDAAGLLFNLEVFHFWDFDLRHARRQWKRTGVVLNVLFVLLLAVRLDLFFAAFFLVNLFKTVLYPVVPLVEWNLIFLALLQQLFRTDCEEGVLLAIGKLHLYTEHWQSEVFFFRVLAQDSWLPILVLLNRWGLLQWQVLVRLKRVLHWAKFCLLLVDLVWIYFSELIGTTF